MPDSRYAPWQRLYFLPDPHQHGSLRPMSRCSLTTGFGEPMAVVSGAGRKGCEPAARRGDRVRALQLLVLVGERLRRGDGLELLLGLVPLHLDVEQRQHDLLADHAAELLEHRVPFAAVLDERILLRHRAEMHALAEVVHRLEVLAPARVDDLQDHVPLDLAHELRPERLLPLGVRVERVTDELAR